MSTRSVRRPQARLPRRPSTRRAPAPRRRRGRLAGVVPAALILAGIAVLLFVAFGQLGTAHSSARTEREVVTAGDGVVQKTVTGTGNVEPVTDEDVDFQTSGTLKHVYVTDGEHVRRGQLLATLDDVSAGLTLKEARATLAQARTTLMSDRRTLATENDASSSDDTSDDSVTDARSDDVVDEVLTTSTTPATSTAPTRTTSATTPTTTATQTTTTATTATTPTSATTPTTTTDGRTTANGQTATTGGQTTTSGSSSGSSSTGSSSSSSSATVTAATVDSDKLAIVSDEATVKQDATDLAQTRLRAPVSGTITSLESIDPGDSVSSGTDSSDDSSSTSDDGSDSSSSTGGDSTSQSSTGASTTGSSSTSSTAFAEIDSLRELSMTVTFTESDISELKVGEPAVVTMDALSGVELAGKVTAVSSLGTTDDDVVSYDATVTLDQYDSRVKPGMSASAEVIVKQGHGVAVSSSAVTGSGTLATVTLEENGKDTTRKVLVGLRGSSEDLILSGVKAGDRLVETETLPSKGSTAGSSSSSSSTETGRTTGGRGFGAGGGTAGGFGGGAGAAGGGVGGGGGPP